MAKYTSAQALKRIDDEIVYRTATAIQKAEEAVAALEKFIAEVKRGELGGYATSALLQGSIASMVTEASSQAGLTLGYLAANSEYILAGVLEETK